MSGRRSAGWISILRKLGSLLGRGERRPPAGERIVLPWRDDSLRTHPTVGLTPARVLSLLHAADGGWPQAQFELFDEMLQKWPRLASVEATRRLALTGLEWDVAPERGATGADGRLDRQEAQRVAEYCRTALDGLERLHEVLDHLATAVGYGIAVAEIVWEEGRLADLVPVPHGRLISDPHEPWRLRVRTEQEPNLGVALDEHPFKWIVHQPRCRPGRPFEGGLLRASALLYLAQNLGLKDWLVYSQVAGMPIRVAQFAPGTPDADKKQLLRVLESLGTDAVAVLSNTVDLKFVEPGPAGEKPYKPIQEYCNTEVTILWLGQHLTTDIRTSGSRAAAEVHDRVREDLLVDDMRDEASTLRRDLLAPMARARFGDAAPVPHFRRSLVESVDTKVLAETLAVAVRELGLSVPEAWVRRALGIPQPVEGEAVLQKEAAR